MLKSPKGPHYTFRHYETVQNFHFSMMLGFVNIYPPIIFFNTNRILEEGFQNIALYSNFGRYILTILRFAKLEAEVRKEAPDVGQHAISNYLKRCQLCVFRHSYVSFP